MDPNKLLRLPKLIDLVGLQKSSIYARISDGRMPKPVHCGTAALWIATEIANWLNYVRENRQEPPRGFYPQRNPGT